ncbi:MAG: hypothetical protein NVSMB6_14830 [Burkholderiaceae bacterium]
MAAWRRLSDAFRAGGGRWHGSIPPATIGDSMVRPMAKVSLCRACEAPPKFQPTSHVVTIEATIELGTSY